MTKSEYIKRELNRWETEVFKDHVAELKPVATSDPRFTPPMLILWCKPGTWTYACYYTIFSQWVMCCGDLFEAQYQWGENVSPQFLASIDLGYFLSKCRSSPKGRKWESWSDAVAAEYLESEWKEFKEYEDEPSSRRRMRDILTTNEYSMEALSIIASSIYDETGDAEFAAAMRDAGNVPAPMAIGQFVGLQMALKQIMNPTINVNK